MVNVSVAVTVMAVGVCAAGAAGPSGASPLPPLDQERRFAAGLLERGYSELALSAYRHLAERHDADTADRLEIAMCLADAALAVAAHATDAAGEIEGLSAAAAALAAQLRHTPQGPDTLALVARLADVVGERGRARHRLAQRDAGDTSASRREAAADFERARGLAEAAIRLAEAGERAYAYPGAPPAALKLAEESARLRVSARLKRAWLDHYEGLLYPLGSAERSARMNGALKGFREFAADLKDSPVGVYGTLGEGLTLAAQGRDELALAALERAITDAAPNEATSDALGLACFHKTQLLLTAKRFDEAAAAARAALDHRTVAESPRGAAIRLQLAEADLARAEALRAAGQDGWQPILESAARAARAVMATPALAPAAEHLLAACLRAGAPDRGLSLAERLAVAEVHLGGGHAADAAALFEAVAVAAQSAGDAALAARAWLGAGRAHRALQAYDAAVAAFDRVAGASPADPMAAEALIETARTRALERALAPSAERTRAYRGALLRVISAAPDAPQAADARFYLALLCSEEGDPAGAVEAFAQVPDGSRFAAQARYLQGATLWEAVARRLDQGENGLPDEALEACERALNRAVERTGGEDAHWGAAAVLTLADLYGHPRVGREAEAVALLAGFEARFPSQRTLLPRALERLARHRLAAGDTAAAGRIAERLTADFNESADPVLKAARAAAVALAAELGRRRQAHLKAGRTDQAQALVRPLEVLLRWRAERLTGADEDETAERWVIAQLFLLNDDERAAEAARRYLGLIGAVSATAGPVSVRLVLADALVRLERFDEARPLLEALAGELPDSAAVRANLARCRQAAEDFLGARDLWIELKDRTPPGSDVWFQARYNLALCYRELAQPEEALAVVRFTRALRPELGGPELKARFDALEAQLTQRPGR